MEVYGFRDHATYRDNWPLIAAAPDAWDRVAARRGGAGLRAARPPRSGSGPATTLALPTPGGAWTVPVAAVYADYGNAEGQVMVAADALIARWPDAEPRGGSRCGSTPAAAPRLVADLRAAFALAGRRRSSTRRAVKALSPRHLRAHLRGDGGAERADAGGGRGRAPHQPADARRRAAGAAGAALGARRHPARGWRCSSSAGRSALAALTALLALPLGLALAWVLTAVVNVARLRLAAAGAAASRRSGRRCSALALATAALAALWPALRLARAPPLALLQEFSNER